jgi:hypothetical protein
MIISPKYTVSKRVRLAKPQAVVDFAMFGAVGADKLKFILPCSKSGIIAFKTFFQRA